MTNCRFFVQFFRTPPPPKEPTPTPPPPPPTPLPSFITQFKGTLWFENFFPDGNSDVSIQLHLAKSLTCTVCLECSEIPSSPVFIVIWRRVELELFAQNAMKCVTQFTVDVRRESQLYLFIFFNTTLPSPVRSHFFCRHTTLLLRSYLGEERCVTKWPSTKWLSRRLTFPVCNLDLFSMISGWLISKLRTRKH